MSKDSIAAGPRYKPRMLMNQHFSTTGDALGAGPFTTIQVAWATNLYGASVSPLLAPFPISTPCRLVRWASMVQFFAGGGGGTWRWDFFLNGVVVSSSAAFALAAPGLFINNGRPLTEFDITPNDHWGPELVQNAVLTGIGVAIARLDVTLEVL